MLGVEGEGEGHGGRGGWGGGWGPGLPTLAAAVSVRQHVARGTRGGGRGAVRARG